MATPGLLADVNIQGHVKVLLRVLESSEWAELWRSLQAPVHITSARKLVTPRLHCCLSFRPSSGRRGGGRKGVFRPLECGGRRRFLSFFWLCVCPQKERPKAKAAETAALQRANVTFSFPPTPRKKETDRHDRFLSFFWLCVCPPKRKAKGQSGGDRRTPKGERHPFLSPDPRKKRNRTPRCGIAQPRSASEGNPKNPRPAASGWCDDLARRGNTFADVGLSRDAKDVEVWRLCQERQLLLVTANRNKEGDDSLEATIQTENTATSLPVLTLADAEKIRHSRTYAEQVVLRLLEYLVVSYLSCRL